MVILIVGAFNPLISLKGAWDGIRLVLFGVLSTGRDAAGALTFGFNPTNIGNMLFRATPLILTGVSVAVAFKTGLFNIGAPASTWPVPQLPCSWRFPSPAAAFPPGSSGSSPSWAVCWPVPCGALSPAC